MLFPFNIGARKRDPKGVRYADVYGRTVAAAIDLGILFLLMNPLFDWLSSVLYAGIDHAQIDAIAKAPTLGQQFGLLASSGILKAWCMNMGIQVVLLGLVYVATQVLWGMTPGKWLVGIKIVRAETFAPLSAWRYVLRFLAYLPASLPLMLGVYWASFNPKRRGWHDFIAGTVVIHTRPEGWAWLMAKNYYRKWRGLPEPVVAEAPAPDSPPVE